MTLIYISIGRITEDNDKAGDIEANLEFSGDTWMDALDKAYEWLKANRRETHYYHVWC